MPKGLCISGMVIAILIFLLFLSDLVVPSGMAPFKKASMLMDIAFVICAAGLGYLSWSSFRELK